MSAESKVAILADESRFQEACGKLVQHNVLHCLSQLMYSVGQNLEASAKMFDTDYDEMLGWYSRPDYEEAASQFILHDADLDDLEAIAEDNGYWDDLLDQIGYNHYTTTMEESEDGPLDLEDWMETLLPEFKKDKQLRNLILNLLTEPEDYQKVCEEYSLEPDMMDVYEYWAVNNWYADKLKQHGQLVFEFADFTAWGRMTTGQSISIDHITREICREMPDYAYVWDVS